MERLGAPVPELSSDLLPKDQVLAPCVSDHSCRSNRHQHRQPVFLVELDSPPSPPGYKETPQPTNAGAFLSLLYLEMWTGRWAPPVSTNLKSCIRTLHQHPRLGVVDKLPLSTLIFPRNRERMCTTTIERILDQLPSSKAKKNG